MNKGEVELAIITTAYILETIVLLLPLDYQGWKQLK